MRATAGSAPVPEVSRSSRIFGNPAAMTGIDWALLAIVLVGAAAVRAIFYTGFFGSDEVTYVDAAMSAANGSWPNSTYIGAIRLGVNLPIAAAISIFGTSEPAVASWGFVCSVVEVAAVYWFGNRTMGRPLAVVASLVLALLPLHVHLAGRIMADPPLALFITATFVLLFEAQQRQSNLLYLLAGVCAGLTFWIKEAALIFVAVPVLWAVVRRDAFRGWAWFFGGLAALVAGNFASMWVLSGNPMHLLSSVGASLGRYDALAAQGNADYSSAALYYPDYLFLRVWHTWLLGYFAVLGIVTAALRIRRNTPDAATLRYLLVWAVGLVGIFSLMIVSVSPLRFIPKQTNYMTIFLAPLSVLAGIGLLALRPIARSLGLSIYVLGALVLCALEQQTIYTFTANSRTALVFAGEHPEATVYVVTNAERLNRWVAMVSRTDVAPVRNLRSMSFLFDASKDGPKPSRAISSAGDDLAIVDVETIGWGNNGIGSVMQIPPCWEKMGTLPAKANVTAAGVVTRSIETVLRFLPAGAGASAADKLAERFTTLPALLYRVPAACAN